MKRGPGFSVILFVIWAFAGSLHADGILISEFQAVNSSTLQDEDGEYPDWLEIYNSGDVAVDLDGWALTDSPTLLSSGTSPR